MRIRQALAEANPLISRQDKLGAMTLSIGDHFLARFISSHRKPAASATAPNDHSLNALTERRTLEEIRKIVIANGCTKAQFEHARETVGNDPQHVAMYLQRYAFKSPSE